MEASSPWTLNAPGVFVQGLRICDAGGQAIRTHPTCSECLAFFAGKNLRGQPQEEGKFSVI